MENVFGTCIQFVGLGSCDVSRDHKNIQCISVQVDVEARGRPFLAFEMSVVADLIVPKERIAVETMYIFYYVLYAPPTASVTPKF